MEKKKKINEKIELFAQYYCNPMSETFHNAYRSMVKAGYSDKTSRASTNFIVKPDVQDALNRMRNQYLKPVLEDAFHKAVELKVATMQRDLKDFYRDAEYKDEDGNTHTYSQMIPLEELTEDQRKQIKDIEYKGARGVPGYQFLEKESAIKDIFLLHEKFCKDEGKTENNIEVTLEGIRDKVTAKVKIIESKNKESQIAENYKEEPEEKTEEL